MSDPSLSIAADDLPALCLPGRCGLVVGRRVSLHAGLTACAPGCDPGGVPAGGPVVATELDWLPVAGEVMERVALGMVAVARVSTVVGHRPEAGTVGTALAVAVAGRLRVHRLRTTRAGWVVTTATRPDLHGLAGVVRLPHLATLHAGHTATDHVIWELTNPARYAAWLGGAPEPDHDTIEDHLPGLLALRRLERGGALHRVPGSEQVRTALGASALTTGHVYRQPQAFLPAARHAPLVLANLPEPAA